MSSADFSSNGLANDFRKVLFHIEDNDLYSIKTHIDLIKQDLIPCIDVEVEQRYKKGVKAISETCELELYDPPIGMVRPKAGLNWGFAAANVNP